MRFHIPTHQVGFAEDCFNPEFLAKLLDRYPALMMYKDRLMRVFRHTSVCPDKNMFSTMARHISAFEDVLDKGRELILDNPVMLKTAEFRGRPILNCMKDTFDDPLTCAYGTLMACAPTLRDETTRLDRPVTPHTPPPQPDYSTLARPTEAVMHGAYRALSVLSQGEGRVEWARLLGVPGQTAASFTYDHALALARALDLPEDTHIRLLKTNFALECARIYSEAFAHNPDGWARINVPVICMRIAMEDQHVTVLSDAAAAELKEECEFVYDLVMQYVKALSTDIHGDLERPPRKAARWR